MQDTTRDQDTKARRTAPIMIDSARIATPHAEALRDVHSSLVRAGQNLYNLVQSQGSQPNGAAAAPSAFAYPQAPSFQTAQATQGFAPAYPNGSAAYSAYPGFAAPGYATPFPQAAGIGIGAFGTVPAINPWGAQATASPWKALGADIAAALGALQHAAAIAPGAFAADAFAPAAAFGSATLPTRTPAIDLVDEGKQFTCLVDLPGLKASQVELLCVEEALVVSAYREAADSDSVGLVQAERGLATMQRTIPLPAEVQPASVKATLANGVLTVVLPKVNPTEGPRRIKVQG